MPRANEKRPRFRAAVSNPAQGKSLALTGFEATIGLIDDVGPATTTNHAVIAMTVLERLQRITDLHGANPAYLI